MEHHLLIHGRHTDTLFLHSDQLKHSSTQVRPLLVTSVCGGWPSDRWRLRARGCKTSRDRRLRELIPRGRARVAGSRTGRESNQDPASRLRALKLRRSPGLGRRRPLTISCPTLGGARARSDAPPGLGGPQSVLFGLLRCSSWYSLESSQGRGPRMFFHSSRSTCCIFCREEKKDKKQALGVEPPDADHSALAQTKS